VVLDGSGSTDEDGGMLSYSWKQLAGPPVTLSDPAAVKPAFVTPNMYSPAENLIFELIVTDSGGMRDKAKVTVTVESS
jgi:hypothetical protein